MIIKNKLSLTKQQKKLIQRISKIHIKNIVEQSHNLAILKERFKDCSVDPTEIIVDQLQKYEQLIINPSNMMNLLNREEIVTLRSMLIVLFTNKDASVDIYRLEAKLILLENVLAKENHN